jgi:hypothetical protein
MFAIYTTYGKWAISSNTKNPNKSTRIKGNVSTGNK